MTNEVNLYITPDGVKYYLDVPPQRAVISIEGEGMPPIDYVSQRGPYQHGETLRDFFLKPRLVQMIVRHNYCSRQDYWKGRTDLLNALRMNRNSGSLGQGVLRKIEPDGTTRDLACLISQGPNFAPRKPQEWDEWAYTETLRFTAFNPIYFDPKQQNVTFPLVPTIIDMGDFQMTFPVTFPKTAVNGTSVFPLIFPFVFEGFSFETTINYQGNWVEYPTITVIGPLLNLTITNVTTGKYLSFTYPLPEGRTVTFDLQYGSKTITLDDGTNLIGYLDAGSNLVDFALQPEASTLRFGASNTTPKTQLTLSYFNRYIGV